MSAKDCIIERIQNYSIDLHPVVKDKIFSRYGLASSEDVDASLETFPDYRLVDLLCEVMIAYGRR